MRSSPLVPTVLAAALIIAATAAAAAAPSAEAPAPTVPGVGNVTRVFTVRHLDTRPLASVLEMHGGAASPQPELGVIAWTGPASQLAAVEATVTSLDQAPPEARNIVLTAWLVDLTGDGDATSDLPAPVRAAIERLADARPGCGARLLERAVLRVRDDSRGAEVKGQLSGPAWSAGSYTLRFRHLELVPAGAAQAVRLDGLTLQAEAVPTAPPGPGEPRPVSSGSLATDVDLPLGGTAAIGATTLSSSGHALVLVLRAAPAE